MARELLEKEWKENEKFVDFPNVISVWQEAGQTKWACKGFVAAGHVVGEFWFSAIVAELESKFPGEGRSITDKIWWRPTLFKEEPFYIEWDDDFPVDSTSETGQQTYDVPVRIGPFAYKFKFPTKEEAKAAAADWFEYRQKHGWKDPNEESDEEEEEEELMPQEEEESEEDEEESEEEEDDEDHDVVYVPVERKRLELAQQKKKKSKTQTHKKKRVSFSGT